MEIAQGYPVHSLARLFPPLSPGQYEALVASIRALGLLDPIPVWQGQIIDGLHRMRACKEAGVEPRYEFLDDAADPVQYVIAKNGTRREMDESQRAVVAHELSRWSAPGRPREEDENCSHLNSFTQGQAAQALRVGRTMVSYAKRVLSEDSPAVPELREAVQGWRIKVSDAAGVAKKTPEVQKRAIALLEEGAAKTITRAVRQAEREIADAEEAEVRESNLTLAVGDTVTLHTATVAGLPTLVPMGSVDAIITRPPESQESLAIFSDLADFAVHALSPDGVLVIVAHGIFLPWVLKNLEHGQLHWMAELDLVFRGEPAGSGRPRFMRLHRWPVLVYSKGTFQMNGMDDLLEVPPPGELPVGLNEQETAMALLVERFARSGQTVCDPVMLDRAGTALAARRRGCIFVGAEKTQSCIDRIRNRLEDAEGNGKKHLDGRSPSEEGSDK